MHILEPWDATLGHEGNEGKGYKIFDILIISSIFERDCRPSPYAQSWVSKNEDCRLNSNHNFRR